MIPEAAHQQAIRRIEAARERKAQILDLGDLPLTQIPADIVGLADTLQVLALGSVSV